MKRKVNVLDNHPIAARVGGPHAAEFRSLPCRAGSGDSVRRRTNGRFSSRAKNSKGSFRRTPPASRCPPDCRCGALSRPTTPSMTSFETYGMASGTSARNRRKNVLATTGGGLVSHTIPNKWPDIPKRRPLARARRVPRRAAAAGVCE
jgi:hypothetical protein